MKVSLFRSIALTVVSALIIGGAVAQAAEVSKSVLIVGQRYYITADGLNVRSSNSLRPENIIGQLSKNDVVELYDVLNAATPLVQVHIVQSRSISPYLNSDFYISKDYLSDVKTVVAGSKYFVIQNIATEKTRVYERCTETPSCPHKLVMETDMVVGRPEEGDGKDPNAYKTWAGHAKISEWVKFYQDGLEHYPRWYTPGQSLKSIPRPVTDGLSLYMGARRWSRDNEHGERSIYGAFGWYAAKLTPAGENGGVNYQWMHGTIGWGKDGSKPIEVTRKKLINFFGNPGSAGCTRLENQAIAYLRHLLEPGTDIYRIYAREGSREAFPYPRYNNVKDRTFGWNWILLTDGAAQSNGLTADAETIRARGIRVVPGFNLIESGTYEVDRYPTVVPLNYRKSAASGLSGDRYEIDDKVKKGKTNFRGYFLVDEGRLVDYQHPSYRATNGAVRVGGLPDFTNSVPEVLQAGVGRYYVPEAK